MRCELFASIDALCGFAIVVLVSQKYIWHKVLRIAIDHRKPSALHLDHDAMAAAEGVMNLGCGDLSPLFLIAPGQSDKAPRQGAT